MVAAILRVTMVLVVSLCPTSKVRLTTSKMYINR
jgi:hypothetical protein